MPSMRLSRRSRRQARTSAAPTPRGRRWPGRLAATGLHTDAEVAAPEAVAEAYATEQTSERAAADALLESLE